MQICRFAALNLWHPERWQAGDPPGAACTTSEVCGVSTSDGARHNISFPMAKAFTHAMLSKVLPGAHIELTEPLPDDTLAEAQPDKSHAWAMHVGAAALLTCIAAMATAMCRKQRDRDRHAARSMR